MKTLVVARFGAPGPRVPARPKRLRLHRRGAQVTATWKPVAGAAGYELPIAAADGRRNLVRTGRRARRLVVAALLPRHAVTVAVRARSAAGRLGPARTVRSRGR